MFHCFGATFHLLSDAADNLKCRSTYFCKDREWILTRPHPPPRSMASYRSVNHQDPRRHLVSDAPLCTCFILLLVWNSAARASARPGRRALRPHSTKGALYLSITSSASGQYLAAAGAGYGGIYVSADNASAWTLSSAPLGNWGSVTSSSNGEFLAGTVYDGGIYTSADYASTWTLTAANATY
jgi:hypothetical protein